MATLTPIPSSLRLAALAACRQQRQVAHQATAQWPRHYTLAFPSRRRPPPPPLRHDRSRQLSTSTASSAATVTAADGLQDIKLPTLDDLYLKEGDNVVVAMSGGVDSSLTLRLLANLPLKLTVLFMRNWDPLLSEEAAADDRGDTHDTTLSYSSRDAGSSSRVPNLSPCAWERDWADVKRVCAHVGIPEQDISLLDLSKEYWSRVFEPAVAVWEAGQTPNPDVACNREIKFGALMQHIQPGHYLATGHYARVVRSPAGDATLHRAIDSNKDQTYYLSQVPRDQLAKAVFPLAGIPKPSVRDLAAHFALPTADREESMGVCFIGERGHFGDFVSQYTSPPSSTGYLVDTAGKRFGVHRGSHYYTIGQRARVGGMDGRWYVAQKGVGESGNDILLVHGGDHPALQCKELACGEFNWIAGAPPPELEDGGVLDAMVQVRHRMSAVKAQVELVDGRVHITFDDTVVGVAPGQIAGVWKDDQCLGSGLIATTRCLE
ncbi:tRNA-specific 2-thiouridylase MnmA [Vanrija pseudolonga]|uniref:tRNA-5-taurinomethyluridine 2-sulfurtransferase n=1 Tax=Vanrija pseudolonga TaxID=143232 RepID=A0AAF0Y323_9TREE|nr:tRNA-specific 2-thiouridylase MnmA [Vanrija pseudolonga]